MAGAHSHNLLATTVRDWLLATWRPEGMVDFFLPLVQQSPAVACHVVDAFLQLGDTARAHALLHDALEAAPNSAALLLKLAEVFMAEGELPRAIKAAERSLTEGAASDQVRFL
ncbi:hypothetical protein T484DRAFT_1870194 [Baffinella frigidus]|nr:hypothetical protein T484DRAFT_1870194 [Cryptophyta sp. CCMP2293]